MSAKTSRSIYLIGGIGIVLLTIIVNSHSTYDRRIAPTPHIGTTVPVRLIIPKIQVDAVIESVGMTPDGAMEAPSGASTVGWYSAGTIPGDRGSAVISGHFGWKNNTPAVFDNLHKLQIGDRIHITDGSSITSTYMVREITIYGSGERVPEVFTSDDGSAHLNLITCWGIWNENEKGYPNRLVVFTDKE